MLRKMLSIFGAALLLQIVIGLDDDVYTIQYTNETFAEDVAETNLFIMFYAPWCRFYKEFAPTWEELAKQLNKTEESRVRIGKVDCTTDRIICIQYGIKFSPTLVFFTVGDNDTITFDDDRELPELTEFINEQLGSSLMMDHQTPQTDEQQKSHENTTADN